MHQFTFPWICRFVTLATSRTENPVQALSTLIMHLIHIGRALQYLTSRVSPVSVAGGRYRSESIDASDYVPQRRGTKFGERGFCFSGPAASNSLSSDLLDVTDSSTFKQVVKVSWRKGGIAAAHGRFDRIRHVAPICTPSITYFLGPTRVHTSNGISIGSAVFAVLTIVRDRQSDRQTNLLCL